MSEFNLNSPTEVSRAQKLVDEYNASGREKEMVSINVGRNTHVLIPKTKAKDKDFIAEKKAKFEHIRKINYTTTR